MSGFSPSAFADGVFCRWRQGIDDLEVSYLILRFENESCAAAP
jgi:hypothetical protein